MDTLYYHGRIRTMEDREVHEAMLVGEGKILAVGTLSALKYQAPEARQVDLEGRCVLPAFLDAHSHLLGWAMGKLHADLTACRTFDDLSAAMKAFGESPAGRDSLWVIGSGADMLLDEGLVEKLDRVFPDRPCLVTHCSAHGGVYNTRAQQLLGLSQGSLVENPFIESQQKLPPPPMAALAEAFREAQDDYLSQGYILAQEGCVNEAASGLYRAMEQAGALKMAVAGYTQQGLGLEVDRGPLPTVGFTVRGDKIFLDGSPQQRTALVREPYVGGGFGEATMTDQEVLDAVLSAKEGGRQLLAHCNGDAAIDRYLWALEEGQYPAALRPVVIHGQLMQPDQLQKVHDRGAVVSFFVSHTRHWGDDHLRNLGDRGMGISPVRSALSRGIPLTFHQDTPVLPPRSMEPVACAALRLTKSGAALDQEERISVAQGLDIMTRGAAYQYHAEDSRGTLRAGKRADFLVLDRDPVDMPPEEVESVRVLTTVSEGRTLWCSREGEAFRPEA